VYLALPYLAQALGSLDARVVACVRKEEGPRWWWAYQVRVETAGLRFLLVRRYSQFRRLHARLRALPTPAERLPHLTSRKPHRTQSEAFAETRRAALDEYLQGLVGDAGLRTSLSLQAFLELGALVGRNAVLSPAPSPSMRARSSNT